MSHIHVAVGVIYNEADEICIALRPDGKHLAGYWEFPGGKVEAAENVVDALKRELHEELSLTIFDAVPLIKLDYDYPDKSVCLDVYSIREFEGEAQGRENQEVRWVKQTDLSDYRFPDANVPIIEAILG